MPRMARRCMPHPRASGALSRRLDNAAFPRSRGQHLELTRGFGVGHPHEIALAVIGEHPVVSKTRDFVGTPFSTELGRSRCRLARGAQRQRRRANGARRCAGRHSRVDPGGIRASDFVAQSCARDAQCFTSLIGGGDLQRRLAAEDFAARAPPLPRTPATPEAHFQGELRRWRRRELTRIAWRDLAGWAGSRRDAGRSHGLCRYGDRHGPGSRPPRPRGPLRRTALSGGARFSPWSSSAWASSAAVS